MPRDVVLRGHDVRVGSGPIPVARGSNGEPVIETQWVITYIDKQTGDTVRYAFGDEVRDYIVRELTGGVVLAGGNLPKL